MKELTGGSSRTELEKWVTQMRSEPQKAAAALHSIMARGISPERLCESLFALFRDLWLYSLWGEKALEALETSSAERDYLASEAAQWDAAKLRAACELCNGLLPRAHYGMKGDIFSGVIFMELQSIINGEVRAGQAAGVPQSRAASPAAPQSRTAGQERYAAPQPRAESAKPAPAAEAPAAYVEPAPQPQSAPQEAEPALPTGGAELFWKLSSLIDAGDRIAISAALLNAAIVRGANGVEIEFEKETPARNFLSIAHNRKTLCAAAAKLWNLEGAAEPEQPQPESASRAPVQEIQQPERGPRQREEAQPARTAAAPLSNILRRAGAELLYVRSAEMNEEETTEGNE